LALLFSYTVLREGGQGWGRKACNPALVPEMPIIPSSRIFFRCALRRATSACHAATETPAHSASFACTSELVKRWSKVSVLRFQRDKSSGRTPGNRPSEASPLPGRSILTVLKRRTDEP